MEQKRMDRMEQSARRKLPGHLVIQGLRALNAEDPATRNSSAWM